MTLLTIVIIIGALIALAATLFAGTVLGAAIVLGPAVRQQGGYQPRGTGKAGAPPSGGSGVPNWKKDFSASDWLERIKRCLESGAEYVPIAGTCSRCGRHLLRSVSDGKHFGECANLICARYGVRVPVQTNATWPAGNPRWTCGVCERPLMRSGGLFGWQYKECVKPGCAMYGKKFANTYVHKRPDGPQWLCESCGRPMLFSTTDGNGFVECTKPQCKRFGNRVRVWPTTPTAKTDARTGKPCGACGRPMIHMTESGRDWLQCVNKFCVEKGMALPLRTDVPRVRPAL